MNRTDRMGARRSHRTGQCRPEQRVGWVERRRDPSFSRLRLGSRGDGSPSVGRWSCCQANAVGKSISKSCVLSRLLPRPKLRAVVDAKNDERVLLAGFDSMNNDVRQSGDAHFARSRQRSFMADMRERGQEIDRLSNSRADTPGSIGISLRDVFSNGIEMPTCPPCKPQPQRPNFCQVSATSFSEANS
jgi:hypothetical protein